MEWDGVEGGVWDGAVEGGRWMVDGVMVQRYKTSRTEQNRNPPRRTRNRAKGKRKGPTQNAQPTTTNTNERTNEQNVSTKFIKLFSLSNGLSNKPVTTQSQPARASTTQSPQPRPRAQN